MIHSTGSTHVLGAAVAEATGESLLSLARSRLGDPLGIEIAAWTRDAQGFYLGGNEMALTPRAMLRVAVMMRDAGMFQGARVISRDWIEASIQPRIRSTLSMDTAGSLPIADMYWPAVMAGKSSPRIPLPIWRLQLRPIPIASPLGRAFRRPHATDGGTYSGSRQ